MKYVLIFFIIVFTSCSSTVEEHFILPADFKGEVRVIFEEPCGTKIEKNKEGILVYMIPENGVLVTSNPFLFNTDKRRYFYKKQSGELMEIPLMYKVEAEKHWNSDTDSPDPEKDKIGVYMISCGEKIDNGYSYEGATISNFHDLQDSLSSETFQMNVFKRTYGSLKECERKSVH